MKVERVPVEVHKIPPMNRPSLLVSWNTHDIGGLGSHVIDFLNKNLGGQEIAEIDPTGFFPLGGVRFKKDLVQVQEGRFWACDKYNLLIFRSDEPVFEQFDFLNIILDFADHHYQAKELYTLGGVLSLSPHTKPRRLLTVFNETEFKERLIAYGLEDMNWQGLPAISSYLLWVAGRRGLPGVSLWPEIPFYYAGREDPQAIKRTLSFLDRRLGLGLDLRGFDLEIGYQNEKIARLRKASSDINNYIRMLESGLELNEEERLNLTREVYEILE